MYDLDSTNGTASTIKIRNSKNLKSTVKIKSIMENSCLCMVQVSTVLGVAIKEEREQNAWSEGVAIWVAVLVVSLVGTSP